MIIDSRVLIRWPPTISLHVYRCGPYVFKEIVPRIGLSSDVPVWTATAHGEDVPGRYATLEDAMRAALRENS